MATRKPKKPTAARKSGSAKKAAPPAKKKAAAKKPAPAKKKAAPKKAAPAAKKKAAPKKAAPAKKKAAGYKVPAKKAAAVKKALPASPKPTPAKKKAGPARHQPAKERAKAAVKAGAYGSDEAGPIRMTTTLLQTVELPATPAEVYRAYLDAPTHAKITGGTARIDAREGGRMTVGDGYIVGKFIELAEGSKIVQTWRTSEWPDGYEDSRLEFSLAATDEGTRLTMVHESVPTEQAKAYEQGWIDYYWEPMRKHFTGGGAAAHGVREEERDEDAATVARGKAAEVYDDGGEDDADDADDLDDDAEDAEDEPVGSRREAMLDDLDDDSDDVIDHGDDDLGDIVPAPLPGKGPKAVGTPAPKAKVARVVDDDEEEDVAAVSTDDDDDDFGVAGGEDDDDDDDDEDDAD